MAGRSFSNPCVISNYRFCRRAFYKRQIKSTDMKFKNSNKVNSHFRKLAILYGIIWAALAVSFWIFYGNSQMLMLHVISVQYVALPIVTFVFSGIVGTICLPFRYAWMIPIFFGVTYLLYGLLTLSLAQFVLSGVASFPDIVDFIAATLISIIGLLIGTWVGELRKK